MNYQEQFDEWYASQWGGHYDGEQHYLDCQRSWEAGFGAARASKPAIEEIQEESTEFPGLTVGQVNQVKEYYRDTGNLLGTIRLVRDITRLDFVMSNQIARRIIASR